jgi:hypothetical protein
MGDFDFIALTSGKNQRIDNSIMIVADGIGDSPPQWNHKLPVHQFMSKLR